MKRALGCGVALVLGFGAGCGDDSDDHQPTIDVAAACGRITDAACQRMADCGVVLQGQRVTTSVCAQIRANVVESCKTKAAHTTGTQADVDSCVAGFQAYACAELCGPTAPQDPAACGAIHDEPNKTAYTCVK